MRRESSTVIALVGDVSRGLLAGLVTSPNVAVVLPQRADRVSHPPPLDTLLDAARHFYAGDLAERQQAPV